MNMKAIGVLGGLGPQATMDFEARVHAVSQRLIPAHGNKGYPPLVVYYHRWPPVVMTDEGALLQPLRPDPRLLDAARRVGAWADFLVIASNGAHRFQAEIEAAAGRSVLSMIEATLAEVDRRGWRRLGVLTFIDPSVYREPLLRRGLACEAVPPELQARLDTVPPAISAGCAGPETRAAVRDAVAALRERGLDGVILGCTEFPLALGREEHTPDLLNPAALLAEAAVRHAIA